jgi:hypothetical protein
MAVLHHRVIIACQLRFFHKVASRRMGNWSRPLRFAVRTISFSTWELVPWKALGSCSASVTSCIQTWP